MSTRIRLKDDIAQRTREVLSALNMPQATVASKIGVAQTFISKVSRGETLPSLLLAIGLRDHFGVSLDWYLRGEGEPFITEVKTLTPSKEDPLLDLFLETIYGSSPEERGRIQGFLEGLSLARRPAQRRSA